MDISDTLAPNSEQLDAVDLLSGPQTFTIESVARGKDDQPVHIKLAEFPRPWRPGKSMRRVLVACWGPDASAYVGRRLTLFCDETVVFGGAAVGGVRIAALSNLPKRKGVPLLVSRGKSAMFTVEPLSDIVKERPRSAPDTSHLDALVAALDSAGVLKEARLDYCRNVIGRDIGSATDLTHDEAANVTDALREDASTDVDPWAGQEPTDA